MGLFMKKQKLNITMTGAVKGKAVPLKKETEIVPPKSISYYDTIQREIKPLEDAIVKKALASKEAKKVDDKIKLLNDLIESYYSLKSKCVSLGTDYQVYFSKMWEHCHNSKNPDFSYIEQFEKELQELQQNRGELAAKEALHEIAAKNLNAKVTEILKNTPVILQTDIYKQFDPIVEKDIQSMLYFMAKDGIITRRKAGKTYEIKYNG